MERGYEHSYFKGRAMVGYQHYTAETLNKTEWGEYKFEVNEYDNYKYIVVKGSNVPKTKLVSDVYLYENNNVLIKLSIQQDVASPKYILFCSHGRISYLYDEISLDVYDNNKYRIARSFNGITIIGEDDAKSVFDREKNWKDIKGIFDGYAVVNSKDIYYNLVQLNLNNAYSNLLQGAYEISYIDNCLFKYRDSESRGLFFLYNARNYKKSNNLIAYDDIFKISDQLAIGFKKNLQWDFINIHTLKVVYTSIEEPKWNEDTIELVCINKYGHKIPYTINKWGTNLSEESENEIEEPVVEFKTGVVSQNDKKHVEETPETQNEKINIGRFIVVTNDSVKRSERGNYLHTTYSYRKACKCEGYPCWVLLDQKLLAITEKESLGQNAYALKIKKEITLPNEFEQFTNISKDNKWVYFENSVSAPEAEVMSEAINTIASKLRKLVEEQKESIEVQQKRDIEDTKDILRLKAIYDFLKLQGFDKLSICNAITALFPEIEEYIDFTNVKQNYYYGWKRYVENVAKLKRIMPDGYVFDDSKVIKELKFTDNEKIMLDYYTKVKGYQLDIAIEFIQEESSTGDELRKEYETLMRLDDIVDNQRKMLQHEIMDDLIHNFTVMADTSELLRLPRTSNTIIDNSEPVSITSKSTDFKIKEEKHIFNINESIRYDLFERKRFHYYEKPVYYLAYEKHVVILLNSEKARELDADNSRQFKIRGNGDDKKFDQDYSAINGTIANQRENNARIYVFECIDNENCRFFDEFQCIKSERIEDEKEERKIIYFTMKSLIRYNTEK